MNILLTAIGSASAVSVARAISKNGNTVYGTDIYPSEWIYGVEAFAKVYRAPLASSVEYVESMLHFAKDCKADMIIPLTDPECDALAKYKELFKNQNIVLACLNGELNALCRNKLLIQHRLKNIVNTIDTYTIRDVDKLTFPMIAKPIYGRSSEGLKVLHCVEELEPIKNENYILQKYINGDIYTVDCVQDEFGTCVCLARKELMRTVNGLGTVVEFFDKPTAETHAEKIMRELGIVGCVNMEFICSDGIFYFLEINPRFSGGLGFSIMQGYDFAMASVNAYSGKKISPEIKRRKSIIKQGYEKQFSQC